MPRTGIEPARSCERQILSLLRLPIPPPGHSQKGGNITTFRTICPNSFRKFFMVISKSKIFQNFLLLLKDYERYFGNAIPGKNFVYLKVKMPLNEGFGRLL